MIKNYCFFLLFVFASFNAQAYKKISTSKIDKVRLELAQQFGSSFLAKCEKQDYSAFTGFKMSVSLTNTLSEGFIQKSCETALKKMKEPRLAGLEAVYDFKYTHNNDPIDYFVFNLVDAVADQGYRYMVVPIYHDQNIINAIYLSDRLPSEKKKK